MTTTAKESSDPYFDMPSIDMDEGCPNCGGEGVIYMCVSEYACVDPESGCDLCERRCDWCRPARAGKTESDRT